VIAKAFGDSSFNTAAGNGADASGNNSSNVATGSAAKAFGGGSSNIATGNGADANGAGSHNIASGFQAAMAAITWPPAIPPTRMALQALTSRLGLAPPQQGMAVRTLRPGSSRMPTATAA
jgi:hypothetical protein